MIRYLAVLQLPFLFVTALVTCIGNYWMSPETTNAYLGMVLMLIVLHPLLLRARRRLSAPGFLIPVLLAAVGVAAWVYRPLHLGYWEEESLQQALGLGVLGILSLMAGHGAARGSVRGRYSLAGALATLSLVWTLALDYPAIPLLAVGLVLAVALPVLGSTADEQGRAEVTVRRSPRAAVAHGVVLLAALELGGMVWDFRQDLIWAAHLAVGFLAAALAAAYGTRHSERALTTAVYVASGTVVATLLFPDFGIHPVHSLGAGAALGASLSYLTERQGPSVILGAALPWGVGLALSLLMAQHLTYTALRVALLLPVVILHLRKGPSRSPAMRYDSRGAV